MTDDLFHDIPADLVTTIKEIWEADVRGGGARYQANADRTGQQGQRKISSLLKKAGILKDTDGRWERVIEHGRELYREPVDGLPAAKPAKKAAGAKKKPRKRKKAGPKPLSATALKKALGVTYTPGESYRARAEEAQRMYRAKTLRAKPGRWGHLLDDKAQDAGRNFVDPRAQAAAEARMATGKGVAHRTTFGNMLSSQAMCFNLLGPLDDDEEGLDLATATLAAWLPDLEAVESIEIEHTPPRSVFRDQQGPAGVDCDAVLTYRTTGGGKGVLVLETKFVETGFSRCSHCRPDRSEVCPRDVEIGDDASGCLYKRKNKYLYWKRSAEYGTLDRSDWPDKGCPFRGSSWQLWVNHTLAHAIARDRGADQVRFAVLAPAGNTALLRAGARLDRFRGLLADPDTVLFIPVEELIQRLGAEVADAGQDRIDWVAALEARYVVEGDEPSTPPPPEPEPVYHPVKQGHLRTVEWMGTDAYREIVAAHDEAIGQGRVYFRPTERGVVRIALHDDARGYVGFRAQAGDLGYLLSPTTPIPTVDELRDRWASFEKWLPTVRREAAEEQGVIPWLRDALADRLSLPGMEAGWVLLSQEWRFLDDEGSAVKADVLAVHVPSARLGIVEFKPTREQLDVARHQVREYAACWNRDRGQLAPLFSDLLRALGKAHGNEEAAEGRVSTHAPALFVGVAAGERGVIEIEACQP